MKLGCRVSGLLYEGLGLGLLELLQYKQICFDLAAWRGPDWLEVGLPVPKISCQHCTQNTAIKCRYCAAHNIVRTPASTNDHHALTNVSSCKHRYDDLTLHLLHVGMRCVLDPAATREPHFSLSLFLPPSLPLSLSRSSPVS